MEPIKCELQPIVDSVYKDSIKTKHGKYHGSYFWSLKGFGKDKWVVCTTIAGVDIKKYKSDGATEDDIVQRCVDFLNIPVGKRKKKQLYGQLEVLQRPLIDSTVSEPRSKYRYSVYEKDDEQLITILLVTDQRKNKNFWGSGQSTLRLRRASRA